MLIVVNSMLIELAILIGSILGTVFVILNSLPGAYYYGTLPCFYRAVHREANNITVGFPVVNRVVWGMWGSQFVIWNRIFLSLGKRPFISIPLLFLVS